MKFRPSLGVRLIGLLLPLALTACASLSGAPAPVIGVRTSLNLAAQYDIERALRAYHDDADEGQDLRQGLTQQQYRDMVVSIYLNAIDSRYFEFRTALSGERRELGTGFDFAILGLTTAASVARTSIVDSLSAAAAVMTGTRSSIDRNLYFDQTLPGLLAAMDAARLRVLTRITQNLTQSPQEYPLETAFADLRAYEMAASLDGAIGHITAQASEERQLAQREYNSAIHACNSTEDLTANRSAVIFWARNTARTIDQLEGLARLMGLGTEGGMEALPTRIHTAVLVNYCSNAALSDLRTRAKATAWGAGL